MSRKNLYPIILPAIGAAILAVLSQISLPIGPVPVTLQTFAVALIATLLKPREAVLSTLLYLLLGALGLPVFAGGSGGFQALFGPTAGYLWGYIPFSIITSLLTDKESTYLKTFLANLLGDCCPFLLGVVSLHLVAGMTWSQALAVGVLPFIIPDLIKLILVTLISKPLFQALKNEPYFK
ncbi:biotin transporter BioY [Streptococcus ferus]|uniref:biotin transporter BioY n=1 Tax=Streptococcus ferus TaxID=1345 RepID=UPI00359F6AE9